MCHVSSSSIQTLAKFLCQESEYPTSQVGRIVASAHTLLHYNLHGLFRRAAKESQSTCRSIYWFSTDVAHACYIDLTDLQGPIGAHNLRLLNAAARRSETHCEVSKTGNVNWSDALQLNWP